MVAAFTDAAVLQRRFLEVAEDLRAGHAPRHESGVASAAFRPNFHSRKADEFFFTEEWTEAVLRYAMAGETLVREVMAAVAGAVGRPELASPEKLNQFRSLGEEVAKHANVSLAKEPAWLEFTRIYGIRNRLHAHGQEEAAMATAVEARAAWEGLRVLLASRFARTGVTIAGIQSVALIRRAEQWSQDDIHKVELMSEVAEAARRAGLDQLRNLMSSTSPRQPASLQKAIEVLSPPERKSADHAFEAELAAGSGAVKQLWESATDAASILTQAVGAPT